MELTQLRGTNETKRELTIRLPHCLARTNEVGPIVAHFATRTGGTLVLLRVGGASASVSDCIESAIDDIVLENTPANLDVDVVLRFTPPP